MRFVRSSAVSFLLALRGLLEDRRVLLAHELIDQTLLPGELRYAEIRDKEQMWDAIKRLAIRGAPAIGVGAAFGVVLGLQEDAGDDFAAHFEGVCTYLATSRPTDTSSATRTSTSTRRS